MTQKLFMTATLLLSLIAFSPMVMATTTLNSDEGNTAYVYFQSIPQTVITTNDSTAVVGDRSVIIGSQGTSDEDGFMNSLIDQLWLFTELSPREIARELRGETTFLGVIAMILVALAFFIGAPYYLLRRVIDESSALETTEYITYLLLVLFSFIIGVVALLMIRSAF